MKYIKLMMIVVVAVSIALPGFDNVYARGGESRGGGGWNGGGRGGGGGDQNHDRGDRHDNNVYHDGGGDWWGVAAGAIAGLAVGAAINEANQPPPVVVYQQPVSALPAYGTQVTMLPPGSVAVNVNGTVEYECGPVWYRPYFASSGVYYEVVPPPNQ